MAARQILFIDDEAAIRTIAKASLQLTRNWDVVTTASGHEGIAIAQTHAPDAILLDVNMPKFDGLATLRALKDNPITQVIPVILLTARIKVVSQPEYTELGIKAVIIKPFDPATLATQIETALNWSQEEP